MRKSNNIPLPTSEHLLPADLVSIKAEPIYSIGDVNGAQAKGLVCIETCSMELGDFEMQEEEENIDDPLSIIKMEPAANDSVSASIKQETENCDLDSKIDIEEDLIISGWNTPLLH